MTDLADVEAQFTDIAETINSRERNIRTAVWENGRDLAGVRDVLKPQGLWIAWVDKHLTLSRTSVDNYIALYQAYPEFQTILYEGVTLAMLYTIARKENPRELAKQEVEYRRIVEKAKRGEKITPQEISTALNKHDVDKPEIRAAIQAANEASPQTGRDIVITGAITDLDGHDVPIASADPTLIHINADTEKRERILRHIETQSIPCTVNALTYTDGIYRVALEFKIPENHEPIRFLAIVQQATPKAEAA
jgi:hypothetical protein